MNEREIQIDCLRQALVSASAEPLREAQRLYDSRDAEPRVDSLRAQMTGHSVVHAGDRRARPTDVRPEEARRSDDQGSILIMDERAHAEAQG